MVDNKFAILFSKTSEIYLKLLFRFFIKQHGHDLHISLLSIKRIWANILTSITVEKGFLMLSRGKKVYKGE